MAGRGGRISVLVDSNLGTLVRALYEFPKELNARIRQHTREAATPVWQESIRGNATSALQTRTLGDTARVSVSDSNVLLRSGGIGKVGTARPVPSYVLAHGVEFGADPNKVIKTSRKGKPYKRRLGGVFKLPRRGGYVFYPSATEAIPRLAALWIQTAKRTLAEQIEKGTR